MISHSRLGRRRLSRSTAGEGHTSSRGDARRALLVESTLVVALLGAYVAYVAPTLGQQLEGNHAFRQTQTAYTARIFHENGIDLIHPQLPVLGEPFEVPFEFPLFQGAASLVMDLGVRADTAMRVTGLACFLLTALLLFGLVRRVAGSPSAVAALAAFVLMPFSLVWGRSSMIEYLATAGGVGFAWATIVWRESRRPLVGALALLGGVVGMLVKPTTAVFWILPGFLYRPAEGTSCSENRRANRIAATALVAVPLAAAWVWTRHADAIKAVSPTTAWLTSNALDQWTFGTLSQRRDGAVWEVISKRAGADILGPTGVVLLALAMLALVRSSQRLFWVAIALAAVLPPLVFTNLYFVHDYYLAALTPALAALIGLGAGRLWAQLPSRSAIQVSAAIGGLLLLSIPLRLDRNYWGQIHYGPDTAALALAREVSAHTRPDERVALVGLDWSPVVLYYAHRRGLMIVRRNAGISYEILQARRYRFLLDAYPSVSDLAPLLRWRWNGALDSHSYALADNRDELRGSRFIATDGPHLPRVHAVTLERAVRVRCGAPTTVPSGRRGTWLRVANPMSGGKLSVARDLAPLPIRPLMFVSSEIGRNGSTLICSGQPTMVVDVVDAPHP